MLIVGGEKKEAEKEVIIKRDSLSLWHQPYGLALHARNGPAIYFSCLIRGDKRAKVSATDGNHRDDAKIGMLRLIVLQETCGVWMRNNVRFGNIDCAFGILSYNIGTLTNRVVYLKYKIKVFNN